MFVFILMPYVSHMLWRYFLNILICSSFSANAALSPAELIHSTFLLHILTHFSTSKYSPIISYRYTLNSFINEQYSCPTLLCDLILSLIITFAVLYKCRSFIIIFSFNYTLYFFKIIFRLFHSTLLLCSL